MIRFDFKGYVLINDHDAAEVAASLAAWLADRAIAFPGGWSLDPSTSVVENEEVGA